MSDLTLPTKGITWPNDDGDPELLCVVCGHAAEATLEEDHDDEGECDVATPTHPCPWCAEPMCQRCMIESGNGCCSEACGEEHAKDFQKRLAKFKEIQ